MLSRETLEEYRRMTTAERLKLVLEMSREHLRKLLDGPPDVVDRRFERINLANCLRNRRLLEGLARSRQRETDEGDP